MSGEYTDLGGTYALYTTIEQKKLKGLNFTNKKKMYDYYKTDNIYRLCNSVDGFQHKIQHLQILTERKRLIHIKK